MTLADYYAPDVARKHAELTQQLHRTAWADLWAQDIHFFSAELAFHWRERRKELLTFWEPLGDAAMVMQVCQELDDYRKEDDALRDAYIAATRPSVETPANHICNDHDGDGVCQGGCGYWDNIAEADAYHAQQGGR